MAEGRERASKRLELLTTVPKETALAAEQIQERAAGNVHLEAEEAAEPEAQDGITGDNRWSVDGDTLSGLERSPMFPRGLKVTAYQVSPPQEDVGRFSSQPACGGSAGLLHTALQRNI